MNLFRSEEHARSWSEYTADHEDTLLPLARWAEIFATPMFRARSRPDFVSWLHSAVGQAGRGELMTALPRSAAPGAVPAPTLPQGPGSTSS